MVTQKTILIAEDEEALRSILHDELEKHGFSTLLAKNGKEAIDVALQKHPDLMLLDLLMPEVNGMDALDKIRKDAWGAKLPIIILTNLSADSEELVSAMVKGRPVCYLVKSDWKIADVIKKVKEVLRI